MAIRSNFAQKLIDKLKNNTKINYYSSDYIFALLNIFLDLDNYSIFEKKLKGVFCVKKRRKNYKTI